MNDNFNGGHGDNNYNQSNGVQNAYSSGSGQQNEYNRPYYNQYTYNSQSNGKYPGSNAFTFGLLSMIFSAFSFCLTPTVSIVFGILAIAEANRAKKFFRSGSSTGSGKVMGILGIVISVVLFVFCLFLFLAVVAANPDGIFFII